MLAKAHLEKLHWSDNVLLENLYRSASDLFEKLNMPANALSERHF